MNLIEGMLVHTPVLVCIIIHSQFSLRRNIWLWIIYFLLSKSNLVNLKKINNNIIIYKFIYNSNISLQIVFIKM